MPQELTLSSAKTLIKPHTTENNIFHKKKGAHTLRPHDCCASVLFVHPIPDPLWSGVLDACQTWDPLLKELRDDVTKERSTRFSTHRKITHGILHEMANLNISDMEIK
jgi:hypothetical protein